MRCPRAPEKRRPSACLASLRAVVQRPGSGAALPGEARGAIGRLLVGRWSKGWRGSGLVGVGLVVSAGVALVLAGTRPGYDPYGWLVWGYQTVHLSLDLGGAPSWKPLPFLFTVPYALAGNSGVWLWMITAVSISLAGCVFAGRIAYRVVRGQTPAGTSSAPAIAWAPVVASIVAAVAVLEIQDYVHYILSGQSDPMIATFCLAAIDLHLCRRYRWALALVVLGALGRPEMWPFLGIYTIWAWFRVPGMRLMAVAGVAGVAMLWFGVPWITNGRPNVAGQLAMNTRQVLHRGQVAGTVRLFTGLQYLPVWLAALAGVLIRVRRGGGGVVLTLTGFVALWVLVEIGLALKSFPVLPRFMFESAAVAAVLAGIGIGSLICELPSRWRPLPSWSGIAVAAVLAAVLVPEGVARINAEHPDLQDQRHRSTQIRLLGATINGLGGYRTIRACGEPVTYVAYASALAWLTHLNVGHVGYKPARERRRRYPTVIFLPVSEGGWKVQPLHTRRIDRFSCARLHAAYLSTTRDPSGRLFIDDLDRIRQREHRHPARNAHRPSAGHRAERAHPRRSTRRERSRSRRLLDSRQRRSTTRAEAKPGRPSQ